eukprot:156701-Rhodomonas_salina.3
MVTWRQENGGKRQGQAEACVHGGHAAQTAPATHVRCPTGSELRLSDVMERCKAACAKAGCKPVALPGRLARSMTRKCVVPERSACVGASPTT